MEGASRRSLETDRMPDRVDVHPDVLQGVWMESASPANGASGACVSFSAAQ